MLCGEKLCIVVLTLIMIFFLFDVEILIKIETVNFLFFCFANEIRSEIVYND